MLTRTDQGGFRLPWWLLAYPALLTAWTTGFAIWFFIDSVGAFEAFGIATQAEPFILLSSASRYLGLAVAMWVGLWILRTPSSILTALLARLTMDIFDAVAGVQSGLLPMTLGGLMQPFVMFIGPNLLVIAGVARRWARARGA